MPLLDGLKTAMANPLLDAANEADMDAEFEFETALEAVVDKYIELTDADYAAILDDENPDNIAADIGPKDETIEKIANDSLEDDIKSLESMFDNLLATESDTPEDPGDDPDSNEGCVNAECEGCSKATEMDDDDDTEYDDDDSDDDYVSLDSLLESIFEN